jgi:hypothetical protein
MSNNSKIKIKYTNNSPKFNDIVSINDIKTYEIDFKAWAADNHNVNSVDWSVVSGQASINSTSLTSNIASAVIEFNQANNILIKITATTSVEKYIVWLEIKVKDLTLDFISDYGMRC